MNVVYHSTNAFAPVLGVSIVSLLENNKDADSIDLYVIENGISDENKGKLTRLAGRYGRTIKFISMPDINEQEGLHLRTIKDRWVFDSYCRLFLHHLLPSDIERVLYFDCDVLVVGDISKLWNYDLGDKCIGAVKECISKAYYSLFGLREGDTFCNSGVLLFDLKRWRERGMGDRVRDCLQDHNGYVFFMEQGVMNMICQDELAILPLCYNARTEMQVLDYEQLTVFRKPFNFYSRAEFEDAVSDPVIIHMTSSWLVVNRAWYTVTNHPAHNIYVQNKSLTEWREEPLFSDRRGRKEKAIRAALDHVPKRLLLPVVSLVYNHIRIRIWNIKHNAHMT